MSDAIANIPIRHPQTPPTILACSLADQCAIELANGQVAMLSRRSPEKETANEDVAAVIPIDNERCVFVVADGCGGMARGELAANLAVTKLTEKLLEAAGEQLAKEQPIHLRAAILDGIEAANHEILQHRIGAATTLAIVEQDGNRIRSYHVGDSQILVIGGRGKLKLATIAHSPVGFAEHAGVLSADEALAHDERHVVSNVVGCPEMKIEIGPQMELAAQDRLVLATDGLFDNLLVEEIIQLARGKNVVAIAESVLAAVDARIDSGDGKSDDLAIIVFRRS